MYLDPAGLTASWREGLLARKVLMGGTKGYRNHPQLLRFRSTADPLAAIDAYLGGILDQATARGYNYDATKICRATTAEKMTVTRGQLEYEYDHLKRKLEVRNPAFYAKLPSVEQALPHPLFEVVDGDIEEWEIIKQ